MPLIGCVPNVSEGRRKEVIKRFSRVISEVRGVRLLHVASDYRQNRSLFSFIGTATPMRRAVLALVQAAIEEIDIKKHRGKHPRIGAVDVIPFVPLRKTTMEKCIQLSKTVGKELADSFGIPVYLYEQSATRPERISLNSIREGEFEGFHQKLLLPEWAPDFGPARIHPTAGVVVVGARHFLTAFNILLANTDPEVAEKVAKAIRASGNKPREVRALVLNNKPSGGCRIAVNLFNYKELPLFRVLEAAERSARRLGASIEAVDMIGLVAADALISCLEHYMKLKNFDYQQILEMHFPRKR